MPAKVKIVAVAFNVLFLMFLCAGVIEAKTNTTTTVASSLNPSTYQASVTFTATVSPADATGTVTFKKGSTTLGTGTLSGGVATYSTTSLTIGSNSITASYGGDTNYNISTSSTLTQTVNKADTTIALASSLNPSTYKTSITFTATVSPGVVTGTVTFKDGTTTLGTGTLSSGTATYSTSSLTAGSHSITVSYGGNTNYNSSTSSTLTQTVNKADTTTSITSSSNPSTYKASVTFTATVSPTTASGTVTFMDGTTTLGSGTLSSGTATYSTSALIAGSHSVTATYGGNSNYNGSTSSALTQTVNKVGTTASLTSSPNPSSYQASVTFTASVSPTAATGTVTFKEGTTTLGTGTLSGGSATFSTTALIVGSHSITATYEGDSNYNPSTSSIRTQTVNRANSTTAVTSSPNPSTYQSPVLFTATVSPATATGTVTFKDGTTAIGTGTLSSGQATFSTSALTVGSHSITASYEGDTNYNSSTSSTRTQTVNKISTTTTLSSSLNPSTYQTSVIFTATVTPAAATGTITFKDGTTTIGTGTISDGTATYSTSTLTAGSHSITASYGGNTNYNSSTSSALMQTVNKVGTTTSLTSSPNPSTYQASVTFTATVSPTAATGTVTFMDGSTTLSSRTLSGGSATFSTTTLATGSHSITASYGGNANYNSSASATLAQTVDKIITTSTLMSSLNPSTYGAPVIFTAMVSPTAATGTVTFKDGSTTLSTGTLSGGYAYSTTMTPTAGSHSITASYDGDTNYSSSTSSILTQTVNKANTTTTLTSSQNPSIYQSTVILTATVSLAASTGTVTFMDGSTTLSTSTLINGRATYITSALTLGSHPITASYGGDTNCNGSTSSTLVQTINLPGTTTTLTSSPNPSIYMTSVTFTATVSPAAATGTVAFNDGGATPGTVSLISGVATYSTSALTLGSHPITASYSGDTNYGSSTSAILMQTVNNLSTETVLTSSLNPSTYQTPVTFTATVSPVAATGTVTFKDGTTTLSTRTLSGGQAMYTTSSLASGLHLITAVYNGNINYSGSTSSALTQTVGTITGIEVTPADLTLPVNSRQRFQAKVTYSDGSTQDATDYSTWSSSNASVGTIDTTGILTAVSQGQTTVQATINSINGSTTLTVQGRSFIPAGHLFQYRIQPTATLLPNGKVLIAGGYGADASSGEPDFLSYNYLSSAEIYDPMTRSSSFTGELNTHRSGHTATLLSNGKVLIVGGETPIGDSGYTQDLASAELYDPATGVFTLTGSLYEARVAPMATLLADGKVLIVGGFHDGFYSRASAEIYDPATGTFTLTGSLSVGRDDATATLLNDGSVLVIGGVDDSSYWSTSEIYNPATGAFSAGPNLPTSLHSHSATRLNDGKVLIAGGSTNSAGNPLSNAMIYDPATQTFSPAKSLAVARGYHTATLLNDGSVLMVGGDNWYDGQVYNTAERYDPANRIFLGSGAAVSSSINSPFTATLLNDGTVLIIDDNREATVELYSKDAFPVPFSLQISPASVNLRTGDTEEFIVTDDLGRQRFDAIWTVSNTYVASIPGDYAPTVTALNPGQAILTANVEGVIAQAQITVAPYSLKITPTSATMVVGATREFRVVDERGVPSTLGDWAVSNNALATITGSNPRILTALAPGTVTLSVGFEGVSAQAQITIYLAVEDIPNGTPNWSNSVVPGFSISKTVQAQPLGTGPYLYTISNSGNGMQSLVEAFAADGQQMWQRVLPPVNAYSLPDNYGGLIVTINQTCIDGQTEPMRIFNLDAMTGQPVWGIEAQYTPIGSQKLYCYPEAPQMAIRPDGNIVMSAPGNTSGLPELSVVDGRSGGAVLAPQIPVSYYKDINGNVLQGYSRIGPTIVDSDASAYVEYEVRNVDYPPKVLYSELWLLKIEPDGSRSDVQLTSTTENLNYYPGRIIPDGHGGVIATWAEDLIYPPGESPDPPFYPYFAAHVSSGVVGSIYGLPFAVEHVEYGKNPTLMLGEDNTVFATDEINSEYGPMFASINLNSGALNWAFHASTQNRLALIASSINNGLVAKITDQSGGDTVLRFDSSGTLTSDSGTASIPNLDYFIAGDTWIGTSAGFGSYRAPRIWLGHVNFAQVHGTGGNAANSNFRVDNQVSRTGADQTAITNTFTRIRDALPHYPACDNWLRVMDINNTLITGLNRINTLFLSPTPNGDAYSHGSFQTGGANNWSTNRFIVAVNSNRNPDFTIIAGMDAYTFITLNDAGGFYNDIWDHNTHYTAGPGAYHFGNAIETRRLRELIILHEIAHDLSASAPATGMLLQHDQGNNDAGIQNNATVYEHCKGLIEGPEIMDLDPNQGPARTEVKIRAQARQWTNSNNQVITAENFGIWVATGSEVLVNNIPVTVSSWNDSEIKFLVPEGTPAGDITIVVRVAGVSSNSKKFTVR